MHAAFDVGTDSLQFVRKLEQFGHREGRKSQTACLALLQRTTQITFAPCSRSSPPRTDNCVWQWAPSAQTAIVRARLHDLSSGNSGSRYVVS